MESKINILLQAIFRQDTSVPQRVKKLEQSVGLLHQTTTSHGALFSNVEGISRGMGVLSEDFCRRGMKNCIKSFPELKLQDFDVTGIHLSTLGQLASYMKLTATEADKLLKKLSLCCTSDSFATMWTKFANLVIAGIQAQYGQHPPKGLCTAMHSINDVEAVLKDVSRIGEVSVRKGLDIVKAQGVVYQPIADLIGPLIELHDVICNGNGLNLNICSSLMVALHYLKKDMRFEIEIDMRGYVIREMKLDKHVWYCSFGEIKPSDTTSSRRKARRQLLFFEDVLSLVMQEVSPNSIFAFQKFCVFGSSRRSLPVDNVHGVVFIDCSQLQAY